MALFTNEKSAWVLTAVAAGVAAALTGCNSSDSNDSVPGAERNLSFVAVPVPTTDAEKRSVVASPTATVNGKAYPIGYHTILRSGESYSSPTRGTTPATELSAFGQLYDKCGNPLYDADGSPVISNDNDFSSLLIGDDGKLNMVSHFENYDVGTMYVTALNQDPKTGELSAIRTRHLDFSQFNGGWIHCAGSVTPWGTHLGSEEYEPDWTQVNPTTNRYEGWQSNGGASANMAAYFDGSAWYPAPDAFDYHLINWYDYGWQIEVKVHDFAHVDATKHYSMGRLAHELGYVLPDRKTAYLSDDGSYVGLFRYVADNPGDLSAGTLHAAKWHQTGTENGGTADLTWIDLGHATDAEIRALIDSRLTLTDIFDVQPATGTSCASGYVYTETTWSKEQGLDGECLMLRPGMELAASRLETRRYAAYLGATTEWEKMEGIAYDPATNTIYQSMSRVRSGMSDTKGDIQLPLDYCGTVYAMPLDANYVANSVHGEVAGVPLLKTLGAAEDTPYDPPLEKNECSLDHIAEPDNLTFIPGYKTLIIGEDTGIGHQNDAIWAYNLDSKALTRIETTPYGSETTSAYFYPNVNGWGYLMSVVQHPYGESDQDKSTGPGDKRAYTGYIGPFPAMN